MGAVGDHAVRGAHQQADAAAHHDAMPPAQQRLAIVVQQMIELVLFAEEAFGVLIARAADFQQGVVQLAHIAAGAEGFLARGIEQHAGNRGIGLPGAQLGRHVAHHLHGQRVERGRHIEGGHAEEFILAGRDR